MQNNWMRGGAAALAAVILSGCAYPVYRERTVYRDRPVYRDPPPAEPVQQGNAPIYDPGPGYSQTQPPPQQQQQPRGQKYGVVRAIDVVGAQQPETSGGGALVGGILGAVIGRQFGNSGSGKAAGTAIGAIGGAVVGNEVERQNNAALGGGGGHYRVQVQLDNGAVRNFYFQELGGMRIGDRVMVQGKNLQLV